MKVLLILLAALCSVAEAAKVTTWTDADGVLHFSDRPPAREHRTVTIRKPNIIDAYASVPATSKTSTRPRSENRPGLPAGHDDAPCEEARRDLRALLEQRRRGYRLAEAAALDAREAQLRADARVACD